MNEIPADVVPVDSQTNSDREHLKLLAIFYYMLGGITICFSGLGLIYVIFGLAIVLLHGSEHQPGPPPAFFGLFMALFGMLFVFAGSVMGGLTLFAARSIQVRKRRLFTLVMAAVNCLSCVFMPAGAVLCAFTYVILSRESVRRLYDS